MATTSNAIEHCRRHVERARAELQRREALGRDTQRLHERLKTMEAMLAAHQAARDAA